MAKNNQEWRDAYELAERIYRNDCAIKVKDLDSLDAILCARNANLIRYDPYADAFSFVDQIVDLESVVPTRLRKIADCDLEALKLSNKKFFNADSPRYISATPVFAVPPSTILLFNQDRSKYDDIHENVHDLRRAKEEDMRPGAEMLYRHKDDRLIRALILNECTDEHAERVDDENRLYQVLFLDICQVRKIKLKALFLALPNRSIQDVPCSVIACRLRGVDQLDKSFMMDYENQVLHFLRDKGKNIVKVLIYCMDDRDHRLVVDYPALNGLKLTESTSVEITHGCSKVAVQDPPLVNYQQMMEDFLPIIPVKKVVELPPIIPEIAEEVKQPTPPMSASTIDKAAVKKPKPKIPPSVLDNIRNDQPKSPPIMSSSLIAQQTYYEQRMSREKSRRESFVSRRNDSSDERSVDRFFGSRMSQNKDDEEVFSDQSMDMYRDGQGFGKNEVQDDTHCLTPPAKPQRILPYFDSNKTNNNGRQSVSTVVGELDHPRSTTPPILPSAENFDYKSDSEFSGIDTISRGSSRQENLDSKKDDLWTGSEREVLNVGFDAGTEKDITEIEDKDKKKTLQMPTQRPQLFGPHSNDLEKMILTQKKADLTLESIKSAGNDETSSEFEQVGKDTRKMAETIRENLERSVRSNDTLCYDSMCYTIKMIKHLGVHTEFWEKEEQFARDMKW